MTNSSEVVARFVRDYGMTFAQGGDIFLEADLGGAGVFVPVGRLLKPTLALTSAVRDLHRERKQDERQGVLLHALAARISGECAIADEATLMALKDVCAASLVLEWRIAVPELGALRALFALAALEETPNPGSLRVTLHLAGHPVLEPLCCENKC
ncbi:hypothetical protein Rvan_2352 [Rhodomicrobium vannielii ATCC 17100]|jgi:hypothetical protein|uniref:Uncharacterized protein n=1 Tax=Rhodomicrobium vannielii (strain ATCC 17100 / DSM 162 / LMG 4299 / NCIMB 10020 / ATH 3.1.1) TaxID=648757 RepID=E3I4J4_RHOVT|nr:hypothetical protein [Rhodomicrobium vannielii]ADP71576.1 hypothetical protein Rvan_2352 [Rhodomicrobium vannielii ATCC 17100]